MTIGYYAHMTSPIRKRLKEARENIAISQKKLGVLAGIDEFVASPRVNQYERGVHTPSYETLLTFAKVLSVPVEYFYIAEDQVAEMAVLISRLDEGKKLDLLQQLRQMVH